MVKWKLWKTTTPSPNPHNRPVYPSICLRNPTQTRYPPILNPGKMKDVVKIIKGKTTTYLQYLCPNCKVPHTIPVYNQGKQFGWKDDHDELFSWNGSTTIPSIGGCIVYPNCLVPGIYYGQYNYKNHTSIVKGQFAGLGQPPEPLLPVEDWPQPKPPNDSNDLGQPPENNRSRKDRPIPKENPKRLPQHTNKY
jgi:hypothetical protein